MSTILLWVAAGWAQATPQTPGDAPAPASIGAAPTGAPPRTAGVDEIPGIPSDAEPAVIPGVPPGPPPPPDQVQNLAYRIGLKLRCPVCQGLSVADSTSAAAVSIQLWVRRLVAAGYDEQQIREFFVERYGEWILLEPETRGINLLIWLGPGLAVGIGLSLAGYAALRWGRSDESAAGKAALAERPPKDRYEQRLLEQLED